MQVNLKDNTYSTLKTLAANQNKSIETFLEQLIHDASGKHQPTLIKDTRWAAIYDTAFSNWQSRFDSASDSQDEIDRLQARADVARDMAIAKHRRDVTTTDDADKAYERYVERLKTRH